MIDKLKNNFKLKVVAFVFSFLMWLYVMAEVDPILIKTYSSVPVNIQNMSEIERENLVISPDEDVSISIILRGRRSIISGIDKQNLVPYGRIETPVAGDNLVSLNIDRQPLVEYTMIPEKLSVSLEENVLVSKKISLKKSGKMKDGYKIISTSLNPVNTWISGPKSLIDRVSRLQANYNVDGKTANFNMKVNIIPVDKDGNRIDGVEVKDSQAYLNAVVSKYKTVTINPVITGELSSNLKLQDYKLLNESIEISGSESVVDKIDSISTLPFDLSKLEDGGIKSLQLDIPKNISVEFKDAKAEFNIIKLKSKEFLISKERIIVENKIQNLDISKNDLPENIKVKVNYFEDEETEKINAGNTQIIVNMQDYTTGLAEVSFRIEANYHYESIEIEPKSVAITGLE